MVSWRTQTARALHARLTDVLGDKAAKALATLGLVTVDDLMHHLPRRYLSGTETTDLSEVRAGETVAIVARTRDIKTYGSKPDDTKPDAEKPYGAKPYGTRPHGTKPDGTKPEERWRLECTLTDGRTGVRATFFGKRHPVMYWERVLGMGVKGIFVGKVGQFKGQLQMTHPNFVMLDAQGVVVAHGNDEREAMARQVTRSGLVGIYPATAKLPTWQVGECADIVLDSLARLDDTLPQRVVDAERMPGLIDAFEDIHRPMTIERVEAALARLKFDEALALQLTMAYRRAARGDVAAPAITSRQGGLLEAFDARMPFRLTTGQVAVADEIAADMSRPTPMQRLLQGEVGSGKTVLALRAMLAAVDAGCQAVLLAPTEVLAAQHTATISAMLGDLLAGGTLDAPPVATRMVTVTGSTSAIARRHALDALASGEAGIAVGTHALLYDRVHFDKLGLVVIDEQHRFGVEQRAMLTDRSALRPHVLVMTATPIPRSVAMTVFGDLEVSTLAEVPAGRPRPSHGARRAAPRRSGAARR